MYRYIIVLVALVLSFSQAFTCTTFVLKTERDLVFGRNLDWYSSNGLIVTNKRNVSKKSLIFPPEKPVEWVSKYGSVTFNQFGKEFPYGGINEKGLVVEIMVANAEYPIFDTRPALNELQWVQYQLDNCATIDEVIKNDEFIRINKVSQELHFLICDSVGNSVVIEFIDNKMKCYRNNELPFPVLENDSYAHSLEKFTNNENCRFGIASTMIKEYNPEKSSSIIDYSFSILKNVALSAEWSIVYDIKKRKIHFKTSSFTTIKQIDLNSIDFSCKSAPLIYDLNKNNEGDITHLFFPFNQKINKEKMKDALEKNYITFPEEVLNLFFEYNSKCKCVE
jgi:penicillin V acylase-like amidase (Ntn superfamily)